MGTCFAQRVTVQEYANSIEYVFGNSTTSTDSLNGGVNVDTLRAVVKVGDSHFFTLFLDVESTSVVTSEDDSTGFGIYIAPNWNAEATGSTESNFNYWEVGDIAPKLVKTWTQADTCNGGRHYVRFNYNITREI